MKLAVKDSEWLQYLKIITIRPIITTKLFLFVHIIDANRLMI
jgi:hypothetical protein